MTKAQREQLEDDLLHIAMVSVITASIGSILLAYGWQRYQIWRAKRQGKPLALSPYRYTDAALDRLIAEIDKLAPLSTEQELADYLLEEAEPGGAQERWTLAQRQAFYLIHALWQKPLPITKRLYNSVPQTVMDALFAVPTNVPPQEDTGNENPDRALK